MTKEELAEFRKRVNQNHCLCIREFHIPYHLSKELALAATVAEYAKEGDGQSGKTGIVYDGIVQLKQLNHALSATIEILKMYECDSLTDITGYRIDNGQVFFRVKGRIAMAPTFSDDGTPDLINYVRFHMRMPPLAKEE